MPPAAIATVQQPIAWKVLRSLIFRWFAGSTGLEGIWSDQDQTQPRYPYFSLRIISGPRRIGGRDDVVNTNVGSGATLLVKSTHRGPRHFVVSSQIHVSQKRDQFNTRQEPVADCDARALMESAEANLELQLTKAAFKPCGLAWVRTVGDIIDLTIDIAGERVRRVQSDFEFATTAEVQELETFIEDVTITGTITPPGGSPIVEDFSFDSDP